MPTVLPAVIPAVFDHCAAVAGDAVALIAPDGTTADYRQLRERSQAIARGLLAQGVGPGDRVGVFLGEASIRDFAASFVAIHRAGACAVISLSTLPGQRAAGQLASQQVVGVITENRAAAVAGAWCADPESLALAGRDVPTLSRPDGLAQILFTSGTTGPAKAVGATHANLLGTRPLPEAERIRTADRYLNVIPLGGNSCQTKLIDSITGRSAVVWLAALDLAGFCTAVERYRVTSTVIVPAVAQGLTALEDSTADLSSLRTVGLTGAQTVPAVFDRLTALLPQAAVYNIYGTTESWPGYLATRYDPRRPTALGQFPGDDSVRLVDPSGAVVAGNQVGGIQMRVASRGGRPGRGYVTADSDVFDTNGEWQDTGDLGYLDDEGYLYLVDRRSRMIETPAGPVSPFALESALVALPAVIEATVFTVGTPDRDQEIAAAVALRAEATDEEILAHLARTLPGHQLPVRISRWPRIPLTPGCKPDVPRLVADLTAVSAPVSAPA